MIKPLASAATSAQKLVTTRFSVPSSDQQLRLFSQGHSQLWAETSKPKASARKGSVKEKHEERNFILDVLSANTTKRDVKSYLNKFDTVKSKSPDRGRGRSQKRPAESPRQEQLHVALIKIRTPENIADEVLAGLAQTLSQLSRLGLSCIIVLDHFSAGSPKEQRDDRALRQHSLEQADRFVSLVHQQTRLYATCVYNALGVSSGQTSSSRDPGESKDVAIQFPDMLLKPLHRGMVLVIPPIGFTTETQTIVNVDANDVVLALTRKFSGTEPEHPTRGPADQFQLSDVKDSLRSQVTVDRVIILDPLGGLPSLSRQDHSHVFVNMEQEYNQISTELSQTAPGPLAAAHLRNLDLSRDALNLLSPSSSALITTPREAAILKDRLGEADDDHVGVQTRRPRNPLLFNLLTDKPLISSSLPSARVGSAVQGPSDARTSGLADTSPSPATFVKRGMPLTIIPSPHEFSWSPPGDAIDLRHDPRINFPRLLHLIEDSFGRPLDVDDYLNRIRGRLAGVIIAGDYEGGAILTWETPPGADPADRSRMVPYLDKFAVLRRSQGAGGVADVVFSAMVRTCFPAGVCWRSRQNNPVNKWYFERSVGSLRIKGTQWTMFWTTPGVEQDERRFGDYAGVCQGVQPSWADNKAVVD